MGVAGDAITDKVVQHAGDVPLHAMREMAAVSEIEAKHSVARFKRRKVDCCVRLGAAVRLDVGELCPEKLFGGVDRELLDDIDKRAPAVVSFSGLAFGVLVRQ